MMRGDDPKILLMDYDGDDDESKKSSDKKVVMKNIKMIITRM